MILMMRRCPIQHREACRSSMKLQMFLTIVKFHRIVMRIAPWWSSWCVDSRSSIEKPVALQNPKMIQKTWKSSSCFDGSNQKKSWFFFLRVKSGAKGSEPYLHNWARSASGGVRGGGAPRGESLDGGCGGRSPPPREKSCSVIRESRCDPLFELGSIVN